MAVELRLPICQYKQMMSDFSIMLKNGWTDDDKLAGLNYKMTLDDAQKGGILLARDGEWVNPSLKKALSILFNTSHFLKEVIPFSETFYICMMEHHEKMLKQNNIERESLAKVVNFCLEDGYRFDPNELARLFEHPDFIDRLRCIEQMNEYYSHLMVLEIVPFSLNKSNRQIMSSFRELFDGFNLSEKDIPYRLSDKYRDVRERLSSQSKMKRKRIEMCQEISDILTGHGRNLGYKVLELVEPYFQNFSMGPLLIMSRLEINRRKKEIYWHHDAKSKIASLDMDYTKLTYIVKDNAKVIMQNIKNDKNEQKFYDHIVV